MSLVPDNFEDKNVCIIGMGYVGLTLSIAMAEVGFNVFGVEKDSNIVGKLNSGEPHFFEPKLKESLNSLSNVGRLSFLPAEDKLPQCSVYIITVGTPVQKDKSVNLEIVKSAAFSVARDAPDGSLVIMRSTIKLGTTREFVMPIFDSVKKSVDLAFCPERTVEGKALKELRYLPQIIGGISRKSSLRASTLFNFITSTVVTVSCPETAEMIKMIDNTYRDVSFAFSNEIAHACDASGVSSIEVINAGKLGYDRTNLFLPGPVGGPCLSKDTHILSQSVAEFGGQVEISMSARKLNEELPNKIASYIKMLLDKSNKRREFLKISLLGIAFKGRPETDDLRGTMAIPFFEELSEYFPDAHFYGFDPVVSKNDVENLGLNFCNSIEEAFNKADLLVILNNHPYFQNMPISKLSTSMNKCGLIYDMWNNFSANELRLENGIGYIGFGNLAQAKLPAK